MQRLRKPSPQMIAVLFALSERGSEPSYGYDLCRRLELKAGTVYPILRRLDERGLVETGWEQDPPQGRPPRHLYRLSAGGAQLVAELRDHPRPRDALATARPREHRMTPRRAGWLTGSVVFAAMAALEQRGDDRAEATDAADAGGALLLGRPARRRGGPARGPHRRVDAGAPRRRCRGDLRLPVIGAWMLVATRRTRRAPPRRSRPATRSSSSRRS